MDAGESTGTGAAGDAGGEVQAIRRVNKRRKVQCFKCIDRIPTTGEQADRRSGYLDSMACSKTSPPND